MVLVGGSWYVWVGGVGDLEGLIDGDRKSRDRGETYIVLFS